MKTRTGFISNSSSSSFIFLYDSIHEGIPEEVKEGVYIFKEDCDLVKIYAPYDEEMKELLDNHPEVKEEVTGYVEGFKELSNWDVIGEDAVGKRVSISTFRNDSMADYIVGSPEEFIDED